MFRPSKAVRSSIDTTSAMPWLGAALLLAGITTWNARSFDRRAVFLKALEPRVVALPRPEVAVHSSLGFKAAIADLYWIGAIHYLGEPRYAAVNYAQLIDYIDIIIALAPDLREAYWFGGVAAPWNTGTRWVNVEGAVRILEAGTRRFPDDWKMRMALAYEYAAYQKRFREAGDQLRAAATVPGAPVYLGSLATRMYVTAGDVEGATAIARELFQASEDPTIKEAMKERVQELHELQDIQLLQSAIDRYRQKHGAPPGQLGDLARTGDVTSIPKDPRGGSYIYDSQAGTVRSAFLQRPLTAFGMK